MEVQKTALYNYHKSLGAKFVPFAGYEMPIQYKEVLLKSISQLDLMQVFLMFHIWVSFF